ncbi:hypothetical protein Cgig2_021352 [Carnegiea gigantea]|uniref:ETFB lysine methyltransferase n=1 Tax=Carnegiea gigantea TaxID=171969 RepID=A0A9Q1K6L6_9CARY|nr:hypothetical protein Cgig2_021352 [Carnegiea gigantea]
MRGSEIQGFFRSYDPGLAFGTGKHATTKLCLLLLHETIKGGELFLDYDIGSGILSIAALKAITAASQNAELNNIGPEKLKLLLVPTKDGVSSINEEAQEDSEAESAGDKVLTHKDQFDIVIVNILLNPLLDLADQIVSLARAGATIGLSGIIHDQVCQTLNSKILKLVVK